MAKEEKTEKVTEDGPSQEDFDKMKAALEKANAEAKKYRLDAKAKDEELSTLQESQDSSKSEMDKIQEQIAALTARAEKAERTAMIAEIARDKKLPAWAADRLKGESREELEADADTIAENIGESKEPEPKPEKGGLGRPKESLTPGASNEDDDTEVSAEEAKKIADRISSKNTI